MRFSTDRFVLLICLMASCHSYALEILEDESLSDTSGEGISLLPENFNITFDALSYMRAIPRGVPSGALKHADIYWYGISLGTSDGSVSALSNLNSLSVGKVSSWGSATNPWVLRVESTTNIHYDGSTGLYPIFQYRAPTYTPGEGGLKYAFVGDLQVCNNPNAVPIGANGTGVCGGGTLIAGTLADGASAGHLEMLNVWNDVTLNGSRVSIFQNTYDNSFGLTWLNRINSSPTGVYRLGVAQTGAIGTVGGGFETIAPTFDLGSPTDPADKGEGVYFTDLDINLPWGNLHYQPIIFSSDATGNFAVELVSLIRRLFIMLLIATIPTVWLTTLSSVITRRLIAVAI